MKNLDSERNDDLDITLGGMKTSKNTKNTDKIEAEEVYENYEDGYYTEGPLENEVYEEVLGGGAKAIPEEDYRADEVLKGMARDTVRGHYVFFDLAVLITTVFAIALTLLLMRETDRYGEDNVKLSFQSFMDGSYTQAMSNRYLSRLNIDKLAEKIENISGHLYGFGGMVQALPEDEISPDDQPNAGYVTNFPQYTTATTTTTSSQETTEEVSAVIDPELTGTAVTMKPSSITIETSFTGKVSIYTTLTSSYTTTGAYKPTATKPKTTPPATEPPQSVSDSEVSPSETTPDGSETTPDTSSDTNSETTPQTPEVTETPSVTTTPPETPAP